MFDMGRSRLLFKHSLEAAYLSNVWRGEKFHHYSGRLPHQGFFPGVRDCNRLAQVQRTIEQPRIRPNQYQQNAAKAVDR
jgi:hypothetical protein